jgi:hypothetical protein
MRGIIPYSGSIYQGPTTTRCRTTYYEPGLLLLHHDLWHSRPNLPERPTTPWSTFLGAADPILNIPQKVLPSVGQTTFRWCDNLVFFGLILALLTYLYILYICGLYKHVSLSPVPV